MARSIEELKIAAIPGNQRTLLENDRVMVVEVRMRPGEICGMRGHLPSVIYSRNSARLRFSRLGGSSYEADVHEGSAGWSDDASEEVENVGTTEEVAVFVELKG